MSARKVPGYDKRVQWNEVYFYTQIISLRYKIKFFNVIASSYYKPCTNLIILPYVLSAYGLE